MTTAIAARHQAMQSTAASQSTSTASRVSAKKFDQQVRDGVSILIEMRQFGAITSPWEQMAALARTGELREVAIPRYEATVYVDPDAHQVIILRRDRFYKVTPGATPERLFRAAEQLPHRHRPPVR